MNLDENKDTGGWVPCDLDPSKISVLLERESNSFPGVPGSWAPEPCAQEACSLASQVGFPLPGLLGDSLKVRAER